ncbi:hypothetical protein ACI2OX_06960 [Bacillus sp. N9]
MNGDWHGSSYDYEININGKIERVNDPYAKALLANSEKGVVVDLTRTDQMKAKRPKHQHLQDAIIYELHVRDATIHPNSGVMNKGTFLGLTERATTTEKGYSTALSYIKELGCTHVQLLPINDFARVNELHPLKAIIGDMTLYFSKCQKEATHLHPKTQWQELMNAKNDRCFSSRRIIRHS